MKHFLTFSKSLHTVNFWLEAVVVVLIALFAIFRFTYLSEIPGGFFVDESSIGYNALMMLHTGHDEHGAFLPLYFQAFGDFKNPLYVYSVVPLLALFGDTIAAVRLASAIWGGVALVVFYLWMRKSGFNRMAVLVSCMILSSSPWFVQISRVAFEVVAAPFFIFAAVGSYYLLIENKVIRERVKTFYLLLFTISLSLSFYAYTSMRLIGPVAFITGIVLLHKKVSLKKLMLSVVLFAVCLSPLLISKTVEKGALTARYSVVGLSYYTQDTTDFITTFARNYIHHFSYNFLWHGGDGNLRHVPAPYGIFYFSTVPFLLLGLFFLFKNRKNRFVQWLVVFILVSPVPSALTIQSPHVLRSVSFISLLYVVLAIGVREATLLKNRKSWVLPFTVGIVAVEALLFLYFYTNQFVVNAAIWFDDQTVKIIQIASQYPAPYFVSSLLYPGTTATMSFYSHSAEQSHNNVLEINPLVLSYLDNGTYIFDSTHCYLGQNREKIKLKEWNETACIFVVSK